MLFVMLRVFYIMMYVPICPSPQRRLGRAFMVNVAILFVGYR